MRDTNSDLEYAYNLNCSDLNQEDFLNMLQNGNVAEKQIAALKIENVTSKDEAIILLNNLTGCDGKIREAVAFKINELLLYKENIKHIFAEVSAEKFAQATIDINANICRLILESAELLRDYPGFSEQYTSLIIKYTNSALSELDKFIFRDKKYVINKQLFKLYWCLEALYYFYDYTDVQVLKTILTKSVRQSEYTIREKVAQICKKHRLFPDIQKELKNDENYYVRNVFNS